MYTLEIDECSKTINAILKDGEMFLWLRNGATINETNAIKIVAELNANFDGAKCANRQYVTKEGTKIEEFYVCGIALSYVNGLRRNGTFNDLVRFYCDDFRRATNKTA